MPVETPLVPGDNGWPQYNITDSEFIKISVLPVKGSIMTMDATGRLIAVTGSSAIADLRRGAFQPQDAPAAAPTAEDTDEVQVWKTRSRILLKANVNLKPGDRVELKCVSGTVTPDKVQLAVAGARLDGFIGTIFQIYTLGTDGVKKQFTADDDLVWVDQLV